MKSKLLIIGAGGHGKVIADIALQMKKWDEIAFLDDNEDLKTVMGLKVLGKLSEVSKFIKEWDLFAAIGHNAHREKLINQFEALGATLPILIHPNAVIGEQVQIGIGTSVMAGVIINCCTEIGKGCIINTGAKIDHDNIIRDYVHISPGAQLAGTVTINKGCWVGIGSIIINNINIIDHSILGAGAVVVKDIIKPGTYIGIPAKMKK